MAKKKLARALISKSSQPICEEPSTPAPLPDVGLYLLEIISEMQENEKRMSDILHQSLAMTGSIDWADLRLKARSNPDSSQTFRTMIRGMLDIFTGIINSCATFSTACNLGLDLLAMDLQKREDAQLEEEMDQFDPTSLEWILQSANMPIEQDDPQARLVVLRDSLESSAERFAKISTEASEEMKNTVVLCLGI
jgi:hypothetical protein